mgnify:CR=1 FL=1
MSKKLSRFSLFLMAGLCLESTMKPAEAEDCQGLPCCNALKWECKYRGCDSFGAGKSECQQAQQMTSKFKCVEAARAEQHVHKCGGPLDDP